MMKTIRDRLSSITAVVMILLFSFAPMAEISEMDMEPKTVRYTSSDTGSAIQYTSAHTFVNVGPADRTAVLEMPGGHDYSRPLPLVVVLHGFGQSGEIITADMGLTDSIHENEHLLLRPDAVSYTHLTLPTILRV